MLIYDDYGNLYNEQVSKFAKQMSGQLDDFLKDLFDQGMTVLEARALTSYLKSDISFITALRIIDAQMIAKKKTEANV